MSRFREWTVNRIAQAGTRFLPFADAASETLPLGRLLRLSMFQVSCGMAMVLLVGTLNRVMIVELDVPAALVGVMLALPLLFAPLRALIGFKSDTYVSALGLRRLPYIWYGTMAQWGGFAIMPMALLTLSGKDYAAGAPAWIGQASAALAFLLVGAGVHTVQTVGLALATDLAPREDQPKVVGLMYVMLLVGMIVSAIVFGWLLNPYFPARLIQVIQGAAVATLVLNAIAMWKQEPRDRARAAKPPENRDFLTELRGFLTNAHAVRGLVVIALGTLGFGMADVLLEPYGGQVLGMEVSQTTLLTALFAGGGLLGFGWASRVLSRGFDPLRLAWIGGLVGVPGFAAIIIAAPLDDLSLFLAGTALVGFGGGLFSHGTLTATMRMAPREQVGLALGSWGAAQATAAGVGIAAAGVIRDLIQASSGVGHATAYLAVFGIEILCLLAALVVIFPLVLRPPVLADQAR